GAGLIRSDHHQTPGCYPRGRSAVDRPPAVGGGNTVERARRLTFLGGDHPPPMIGRNFFRAAGSKSAYQFDCCGSALAFSVLPTPACSGWAVICRIWLMRSIAHVAVNTSRHTTWRAPLGWLGGFNSSIRAAVNSSRNVLPSKNVTKMESANVS